MTDIEHGCKCGDAGCIYNHAAGQLQDVTASRDALRVLLDTPELHDFAKAVVLEAAHQRTRWGNDHDALKAPEDWFWTLGHLASKATQAARYGDHEKYLHHILTSAALLNNWHAQAVKEETHVRR